MTLVALSIKTSGVAGKQIASVGFVARRIRVAPHNKGTSPPTNPSLCATGAHLDVVLPRHCRSWTTCNFNNGNGDPPDLSICDFRQLKLPIVCKTGFLNRLSSARLALHRRGRFYFLYGRKVNMFLKHQREWCLHLAIFPRILTKTAARRLVYSVGIRSICVISQRTKDYA